MTNMASSSSSSSPELPHASAHISVPEPFSFKYASQEDVLEDLSSRFILNLPDEELASVERICFQVEQAHWYYEDFIREENPKFPSLPLKKFSAMLFHACPLLRQWSHDHEQAFNTFMQYKTRVPVCGAIMLNSKWDKCLLVKGWKSSSGWGFPKGKINQDEPPHCCAIREVLEETGYDLTSQIRQSDCVEMTIKEQRITLYIVGNVPEDYVFRTRTRKEISKIEWFSLSDLPTWKKNKQVSNKFYLISPFVPPLKEFVKVNKPVRRRQGRHQAISDISADLSVQTDVDHDNEDEGSNTGQDAYIAVRLDRGAHGSSSSSADNGPQTPSPQSAEAFPMTIDGDSGEVKENNMDPHFARLLNGLTMSANKSPVVSKDLASRPSAQSSPLKTTQDTIAYPVPNAPTPFSTTATSESLSTNVDRPAELIQEPPPVTSTPTITLPMTPVPPAVSATPAVVDRHLKHLALLESVAKEATSPSSPLSETRQMVSSRCTNDFPTTGMYHEVPSALPTVGKDYRPQPPYPHTSHHSTFSQSVTAQSNGRPPFPRLMNSPPVVRPMTSHAILPPPMQIRRQGPNMSIHQGKLLSILGGQSAAANRPLHPSVNGIVEPGHAFINATNQASPAIQSQSPPVAQPLSVLTPLRSTFPLNAGPHSAPIYPAIPPQPLFNTVGPNGVNDFRVPGRMQLHSLVNPNGNARSTPTLTTDFSRPY